MTIACLKVKLSPAPLDLGVVEVRIERPDSAMGDMVLYVPRRNVLPFDADRKIKEAYAGQDEMLKFIRSIASGNIWQDMKFDADALLDKYDDRDCK